MKQITTKEIQTKKLNLLKSFQDYCNHNNLSFYMAYGSLIGCIRENGFIPWDEDIDLYMKRKDFNKLLDANPDVLGPFYFIQNYRTDKYCYVPIIRLCIKNTYRCEQGLEKGHFNKGSFIDIFPLDVVPNEESKRYKYYNEIKNYSFILRLKTTTLKIRNLKTLCLFIIKVLLKPISFSLLQKFIIKRMQRYNNISSNYLMSVSTVYGSKRESFKRDWFKETIYKDFEWLLVPCPSGYDQILTQIYGDYMQRPSEEKRKIDSPSYYFE